MRKRDRAAVPCLNRYAGLLGGDRTYASAMVRISLVIDEQYVAFIAGRNNDFGNPVIIILLGRFGINSAAVLSRNIANKINPCVVARIHPDRGI